MDKASASSEWRQHWTLVLASMAGLSFTAIASASMGLFMEPLGREFGWSRAEIAAGLTVYALIAVPLSPVVGAMVDRWGVRRIAIPGIILSALALASFSRANGSTAQWLGLWVLYSLVALAIRNIVWTAAVSSVFTTARGLALAFTLSGSAFTQVLAPIVAQRLIDTNGWRSAYLWMGVGWGAIVLALLIPFFFDVRDSRRRRHSADATAVPNAVELPGLSPREALRSPALLKIGISTLIVIVTLSALSIHLVPILTERGISRETAALMAALAGAMGFVGKLTTGWMNDRWTSGWINGLSLAGPSLACLLLVVGGNGLALVLVSVAMIGYSSGAFLQVCTYLTGRYGGIRNFGKIFGVMASIIALGVGVGPVVAGFLYDSSGSYLPLLVGAMPLLIISGLLVFALGPYPDWQGRAQTSRE